MPTIAKVKLVEEYKKLLQNSRALFLVNYKGLTVEEVDLVRRKFDTVNAKYKVVKNTLFKIALKGTDSEAISDYLIETNGVIFVKDDPVVVSKTLNEIADKSKFLIYKVGILEGKIVDEAQLKFLSTLPSREVLQSQLLSLFLAPSTNMVNLLAAMPRNFLNVLNSYKEKKEN